MYTIVSKVLSYGLYIKCFLSILKLSEKFFLTKVKSNDNIDLTAKCADDITKQSVHSHLSTDM